MYCLNLLVKSLSEYSSSGISIICFTCSFKDKSLSRGLSSLSSFLLFPPIFPKEELLVFGMIDSINLSKNHFFTAFFSWILLLLLLLVIGKSITHHSFTCLV
jgi:hypothetical protein